MGTQKNGIPASKRQKGVSPLFGVFYYHAMVLL
jgi:hypothetical protein